MKKIRTRHFRTLGRWGAVAGASLVLHTASADSGSAYHEPQWHPKPPPHRQVLPQIDHFIVIYQENWSFDGLYGNFPGANGLANAIGTTTNQLDRVTGQPIASLASYDPASSTIPTQNPPVPLNGTQDTRFLSVTSNLNSPSLVNTLLPYSLEPFNLVAGDFTGDIIHEFWREMSQIHFGTMDRFVTWSDNPGLVMSHFDGTDLPEGKLAQQFTLCDNFFHSAFGGSFLNHQFLIAAQPPVYPNAAALIPGSVAALDPNGELLLNLNGAGDGSNNGRIYRGGNITPIGGAAYMNPSVKFDQNYAVNTIISANLASGNNPNDPKFLPSLNDSDPNDTTRPYTENIGDRLSAGGVSWRWYSGGWDRALAVSSSNPANNGVQGTDTSLRRFQWHHQPFAYFDNYAPWVNGVRNPLSAAHVQDEDNFFADVAHGKLPQVCFIKPIGENNEHPGYADVLQGQVHVANIVAAVQNNPQLWAHTAIIITYDEHGGRWDHVAPPVRDIWGPGSRVPAIIISPFAKRHYVDHHQYETLSILKTIEERFNLAPLTSADGSASSLEPAFDAVACRP
ncbi:MAG TPA: acid phosphatase [Dongiaceae bacterium]|nr:acid phosphatase [Dongiaceae bacterium]